MNTFLVILEQEDKNINFLISAEDIAYTTKNVCLMVEDIIVAHFRLDKVISITQFDYNDGIGGNNQ